MSAPRRRRPAAELGLGVEERATYGITATLVELGSGKTRTLALTEMTAMEALAALIAEMEGWEGEWRVRTLSSPRTIFRDLQGTRRPFGSSRGQGDAAPELRYLGKIGRLDLLEPATFNPMPIDAERRK